MTVRFTHESGEPAYDVPGYFAADGDAANSSSESGTKWRAHFSPDKVGKWSYSVSFVKGPSVALGDRDESAPLPLLALCGQNGEHFLKDERRSQHDLERLLLWLLRTVRTVLLR